MAFLQKKKLPKRSPKLSKWLLAYAGALLIIVGVQPAKAENLIVTAPTDYWFNYDVPTTFSARTHQVSNHPSDPQLWLYNSEGILVTSNDDWYGLQSFIQVQVEPGWYRLRAGTCCWEPDVWRDGASWNIDYGLEIPGFTDTPTITTSTTIEETTTTSSTTTTTSTTNTTTTTEVPWTTTSTSLPISEPSTIPSTVLSPTTFPLTSTTTTTIPSTTSSSFTSLPPVTSTSIIPRTTVVIIPQTTVTATSVASMSTSTTTISTTTTTTEPTSATTTVAGELPQALAESVAALAENVTPAQVDAAIQDIADNISILNAEQLDQIALVVSKAPPEIKKKFESEINIFGGGLDNYVPVGSRIPVGERRTLVVIGAVMTAMPVLSSRKK